MRVSRTKNDSERAVRRVFADVDEVLLCGMVTTVVVPGLMGACLKGDHNVVVIVAGPTRDRALPILSWLGGINNTVQYRQVGCQVAYVICRLTIDISQYTGIQEKTLRSVEEVTDRR